MAELTIYDSRGNQLDEDERTSGDERIKDFFFDGVRFAIDLLQREAICFFRARNDEASRSEQYYAVYNYANRQELKKLPAKVEQVVEEEEGMILDTSQDDTQIFDLLRSSRDPELQYVDMDFRLDVEELASKGKPIRLGVSTYENAYAVIFNWLQAEGDRFAIAENATSSNLNSYDIVVDPSGHSSIEALGATEEALESLRERRRQQNSAGDASQQAKRRRKAGLAISLLLMVGGGLTLAFVGSCMLVPGVVNTVPGPCSVVGADSPDSALNITSAERVDANNSNTLAVTGTMDGMENSTNRTVVFDLRTDGDGNETVNRTVTVSSEFQTNVTFNRSVENATALTVDIDGETDTYEFDRSNASTSTATPGANENGTNGTETNGTETTMTETTATETATNESDGPSWWPFTLAPRA